MLHSCRSDYSLVGCDDQFDRGTGVVAVPAVVLEWGGGGRWVDGEVPVCGCREEGVVAAGDLSPNSVVKMKTKRAAMVS